MSIRVHLCPSPARRSSNLGKKLFSARFYGRALQLPRAMVDQAFEQPRQAASVMVGFHRPWWSAGGWAIDLALSQATREHADVEIALFREDQPALREYLVDWTF